LTANLKNPLEISGNNQMNKLHEEKKKKNNDVCNSLITRLIPAEVDQPLNPSMRHFLFFDFYQR